jgi:putative ABC transport system substrate-binding protein
MKDVTILNRRARSTRIAVTAMLVLSAMSLQAAPADGQSSKRTPVVGVLGTTPADYAGGRARIWEGFTRVLGERGWVDGKSLRIEWRWSDGRPERFRELATELVRLDVDLVLTSGSQSTKAAMEATSTIPIVFVGVANPVGAGFVKSLASPGGNVTGVTNQLADLAGKWLQLAKEVVPRLRHVGIMWNPADPGSASTFKDSQESFTRLGIKLTSVPVKAPEDFDAGFEILARERPDFLIVHLSPMIARNRQRVAEFAVRQRLPTGAGSRVLTDDGSILISYGPDFADLLKRGANYVDRVLKGARPADLPVEQPTRFQLVVNRRVARAIGVELTPALLGQADDVIE